MFQNKWFTILLFGLFLAFSCQPSLLKKSEPQKSNIDSVFFYQKKDAPDPFIDGLLNASDQTVILKKRLLPKSIPIKFKEIDGFRVQVFASVDSFNALSVLKKVKPIVKDSVYLIHEKNLFKVQVGDFPYRPQADSLREALKQKGFSGAWCVQTKIRLPVKADKASASTVSSGSKNKNVEIASDLLEYYQIQIFATSSKEKAQTIVDQLSLRFEYQCHFVEQNQLFKIMLGKFATREKAEEVLEQVKNLGFTDAWIVHKP